MSSSKGAAAQRTLELKLKAVVDEHRTKIIDILLETPFWLPSLSSEQAYTRESDDTDGDIKGIRLMFGPDGDAWFKIDSFRKDPETREDLPDNAPHRFRTHFGGGDSPRVRTAMMILARAMELDQKDKPDRSP